VAPTAKTTEQKATTPYSARSHPKAAVSEAVSATADQAVPVAVVQPFSTPARPAAPAHPAKAITAATVASHLKAAAVVEQEPQEQTAGRMYPDPVVLAALHQLQEVRLLEQAAAVAATRSEEPQLAQT
jgi:hypothetical protein